MFVTEKYLNMGYKMKCVLRMFLLGIVILFCSCISQQEDQVKTEVLGRQIYHNDVPYFIKGVCYHPVPKGE